jgi:hypothetical protein
VYSGNIGKADDPPRQLAIGDKEIFHAAAGSRPKIQANRENGYAIDAENRPIARPHFSRF